MTNTETQILQDPSEYALLILDFAAGDRAEALTQFIMAVQTEPSFKLAPKAWVAAVAVAIAEGRK